MINWQLKIFIKLNKNQIRIWNAMNLENSKVQNKHASKKEARKLLFYTPSSNVQST